jgi:hydrogenase 3 maturation protease
MLSHSNTEMEPGTDPAWHKAFQQCLQTLRQDLASHHTQGTLRIAIVGIGHELRGDDAAGVFVARALQSLLSEREGFLIVDAGPAPENFTSQLRRFKPNLILLVDAAQMQETPGSIRLLDWRDTSGLSASTHTLPPYVLSEYLTGELGCQVILLGIQILDTGLGAPLSPPVQQAVESIVQNIASIDL